MKYYISDTHFGHKNVLKLDNRPFQTIEENDEEIIRRWNERVKKDDSVYILGDFSWNNRKIADYAKRLNGQKHLILGNHDYESEVKKVEDCFASVSLFKKVYDEGRTVTLCHYPIPCYARDYMLTHYMLYGHLHMTAEYKDMLNLQRHIQRWNAFLRRKDPETTKGLSFAQFYNVGCMLPYMDYTPRTLDEIAAGGQEMVSDLG